MGALYASIVRGLGYLCLGSITRCHPQLAHLLPVAQYANTHTSSSLRLLCFLTACCLLSALRQASNIAPASMRLETLYCSVRDKLSVSWRCVQEMAPEFSSPCPNRSLSGSQRSSASICLHAVLWRGHGVPAHRRHPPSSSEGHHDGGAPRYTVLSSYQLTS